MPGSAWAALAGEALLVLVANGGGCLLGYRFVRDPRSDAATAALLVAYLLVSLVPGGWGRLVVTHPLLADRLRRLGPSRPDVERKR